MARTLQQGAPVEQDFLPLNGTDYVEFYVGNARQAAHYYRTAFGFRLAAYCGPETGTRDRASYLLVQDKIRFVLTTPLQPEGEIAEHIRVHGDGVRDVALWVDDANAAWRATTSRGARSVREPETLRDATGEARGGDWNLRRYGAQPWSAATIAAPSCLDSKQ
jgi:4-hydroxyphenylpyruvate dioxygenase